MVSHPLFFLAELFFLLKKAKRKSSTVARCHIKQDPTPITYTAKNYKELPLESLFLKTFGKEIFYYNLKSFNMQYMLKWDFTYRKNSNGTNVVHIILVGSGSFIVVEKVSFWFSSIF